MPTLKIVFNVSWDVAGTGMDVREFPYHRDDVVQVDVGNPIQEGSMDVPATRRVWVPTEPSGVLHPSRHVVRASEYYGLAILSWHDVFSGIRQNVKYCGASGCWVKPGVAGQDKVFGLDGFVSSKKGMEGYALRHYILSREDDVRVPGTIWNYRGHWKGKKHDYPLQPKSAGCRSMFHLAIENQSEPGYFSEKLLDAFNSFSIPLYYGAPDIHEHFDMDGVILICKDNVVDRINALTPEYYKDRLASVRKNGEKASRYEDDRGRIADVVRKLPGLS